MPLIANYRIKRGISNYSSLYLCILGRGGPFVVLSCNKLLHTPRRHLALDVDLKAAAAAAASAATLTRTANSHAPSWKAHAQTHTPTPTPTHLTTYTHTCKAHSINATHQRRSRKVERGGRGRGTVFAYACICLNNSYIHSKWGLARVWTWQPELGLDATYSCYDCCFFLFFLLLPCCSCCCCCCFFHLCCRCLSHNYFDSTFTTFPMNYSRRSVGRTSRRQQPVVARILLSACLCSSFFLSLILAVPVYPLFLQSFALSLPLFISLARVFAC